MIAIVISWIYLLVTSYYYLEATLSLPAGANVYSISQRYCSGLGAWFNSILFFVSNYSYILLFFYYGIPILSEILYRAGLPWPQLLSNLFFGLILGGSICLGLQWAMTLNFFLMLVMGTVFYQAFASATKLIVLERTTHFNFVFLVLVIPSLLNSLYFQTMIPTLVPFLNKNIKKLKSVFVTGLSLASLLFIGWLWIVIATTSANFEHLSELVPSAVTFITLSEVPGFGRWLPLLLLVGIATSVLGEAAILIDFISDYLKIPIDERKGRIRVWLSLFLFIPPLFAPMIHSDFFYKTLRIITDISGLYLCGLMPIWWIWSLRYKYHEYVPPLVPGGKKFLLFLTLLSFFIFYLIGLEFLYQSFS